MRLRPAHIPRLLVVSYLLKIGVVAVLGFVAISGLMTMRDTTLDIYRHPFAVSNAAMDFQLHVLDIRKNMLELAMTTDPQQAQQLTDDIQKEGKEALRHLGVVRQGFLGDMRQIDQTETLMQQWQELRNTITDLVQQGNNTQAAQLATHEGNRLFDQIEQKTDYVVNYARQRAGRYVEEADSSFTGQMIWLWSMVAGVIVLIVASSLWVINKVSSLHEEVERQARHDPLTGLPNRRFFGELAQRELIRAQREGWTTALLMVDLDRFKEINDGYGHESGDTCLKHFTEIAQESLREIDILGRIGGDEFAVLLPQTDAGTAWRVAERLRTQCADRLVQLTQTAEANLTLSIGIATTPPAPSDLTSLFRVADGALYQAKDQGRDRSQVATLDPTFQPHRSSAPV